MIDYIDWQHQHRDIGQNSLHEVELKLLHEIFLCHNEFAVEAAMAYSAYLSRVGISEMNCMLVLNILNTNNEFVVDKLIGDREPYLLLRNISPTPEFLKRAFQILTSHNPKEIYPPILSALLGYLDITYKDPNDGYRIYPFSVSELNNLAKYLNEDKDQFFEFNIVILHILENCYYIGRQGPHDPKPAIASYSMRIRLAFFDNVKSLSNIMPEELLSYVKDRKSIKPISMIERDY